MSPQLDDSLFGTSLRKLCILITDLPPGQMNSLTSYYYGIVIIIKIRLLKALVRPVVMYGCESWTLKETEENRRNAFEVKSLRQVL